MIVVSYFTLAPPSPHLHNHSSHAVQICAEVLHLISQACCLPARSSQCRRANRAEDRHHRRRSCPRRQGECPRGSQSRNNLTRYTRCSWSHSIVTRGALRGQALRRELRDLRARPSFIHPPYHQVRAEADVLRHGCRAVCARPPN